MDAEKKVIVLEPIIKSDKFLNHINALIRETLIENNTLFSSINRDGFYFIVDLKKTNEMVFAMDLLSKISGISCVFIAKCVKTEHDVLSKAVIQIGKKLLLPDEKFYLEIQNASVSDFKDDDDFLFFKKDLEFHTISELSSLSPGIKHTSNESEADKTLFVLIGHGFTYVSLSVTKNKDIMPFKFLGESVVCPVYNDYSLLSLASILNSGFFPIPFIFYNGERHLRQILKSVEKIIKRYPFTNIEINVIDIADLYHNIFNSCSDDIFDSLKDKKDMVRELICDEIVITILLKLRTKTNFICLPLLPFSHPLWFFKKNILLYFESGKIPLTPFLFNFGLKNNLTDLYGHKKNDLSDGKPFDTPLFLDVNRDSFELFFQKKFPKELVGQYSKQVKRFSLDVRKDDLLDIFNSV
jgi:hypothetical protein